MKYVLYRFFSHLDETYFRIIVVISCCRLRLQMSKIMMKVKKGTT
jgi:hypothetical protein